jgi:hypothetical protein
MEKSMKASSIHGIQTRPETTVRMGGVGDCWCLTWTGAGDQFTCGNDTSSWPGMPRNCFSNRGYLVYGDPPDVDFEFLPGYPDHPIHPRFVPPERASEYRHDYSGFGTLAVDGRIYLYLATRNGPTEPRFNGAKVIYSEDHGATWCNQDGSTPVVWEGWEERTAANHIFLQEDGDAFNVPIVLQMGQEYVDNRDGYVYVYSPNGNTDGTMNEIVLCRVRKEELLDRAGYDFFAGFSPNGQPRWSGQIGDRKPVVTAPEGWVLPLRIESAAETPWRIGVEVQAQPHSWTPTVVYNRALDVYMMANTGMGVGDDGRWFGKASYLGFWVADQPWGPWLQIHGDAAWSPTGDDRERAYEVNISPKWIAADGRSLWIVGTDYMDVEEIADETEYQELLISGDPGDERLAAAVERRQPYYGVSAQKIELLM